MAIRASELVKRQPELEFFMENLAMSIEGLESMLLTLLNFLL